MDITKINTEILKHSKIPTKWNTIYNIYCDIISICIQHRKNKLGASEKCRVPILFCIAQEIPSYIHWIFNRSFSLITLQNNNMDTEMHTFLFQWCFLHTKNNTMKVSVNLIRENKIQNRKILTAAIIPKISMNKSH